MSLSQHCLQYSDKVLVDNILYIFMPTDEMIAKHLTVSPDQQILCKCNKADT